MGFRVEVVRSGFLVPQRWVMSTKLEVLGLGGGKGTLYPICCQVGVGWKSEPLALNLDRLFCSRNFTSGAWIALLEATVLNLEVS